MTDRIFGPIAGQERGAQFPDRASLAKAGLHKPTQAGISYSEREGADSIVLSGGYEDDEDFGDVIIYTGQGGQDKVTRKQVEDQRLTRGNLGLVVSSQQGLPVRVVRGSNHKSEHSPPSGYQYAGTYRVEQFWREAGLSGLQVYRYRLVLAIASEQDVEQTSTHELPLGAGTEEPGRVETTTSRVIRDTRLSRELKRLYKFKCQVCGVGLMGPGGPYAEAAHIRPLGRPHNGPDQYENLICLCPNHHYLFDVGAFGIQPDLRLVGIDGFLKLHPKHRLDIDHLDYHREHFRLGECEE